MGNSIVGISYHRIASTIPDRLALTSFVQARSAVFALLFISFDDTVNVEELRLQPCPALQPMDLCVFFFFPFSLFLSRAEP